MKQYLIPFLVGVAFVACMLVFYQIGDKRGYNKGYADGIVSVPAKSDTVWRTDTHFVDRPVPVETIPSGVEMMPVGTLAQMQARIDSLRSIKPDTTFVEVPVPIETKHYGGKPGDNYEAQVSGWHPELDWIKVFPKTAYITETKVIKKKWSLGLAAGPGVFWNGNKIEPGLGAVLGVQYNF